MAWHFTTHVLQRMKERGIEKAWINHAIANHDTILPCKGKDHAKIYQCTLNDGRTLRVWVDEKKHRVISAAWMGVG